MASTNRKAPAAVDVSVGAQVRFIRMMRSVSQEKLAEACGITFQQIQKYEKGTNRIGASRLMQIAVMLEVPVARFFEQFDQTHAENTPVASSILTADGIRLNRAFGQIADPVLRRRVLGIVEHIAGSNLTQAAA